MVSIFPDSGNLQFILILRFRLLCRTEGEKRGRKPKSGFHFGVEHLSCMSVLDPGTEKMKQNNMQNEIMKNDKLLLSIKGKKFL